MIDFYYVYFQVLYLVQKPKTQQEVNIEKDIKKYSNELHLMNMMENFPDYARLQRKISALSQTAQDLGKLVN